MKDEMIITTIHVLDLGTLSKEKHEMVCYEALPFSGHPLECYEYKQSLISKGMSILHNKTLYEKTLNRTKISFASEDSMKQFINHMKNL